MKKKLAIVAAGLVGVAAAWGGGSEAPIKISGESPAVWVNTTIRQWVGSVVCTFPTSRPPTSVSISIVDSLNATNLIAYGTNSAMQTFVYVSERGPLVINKGDSIRVEYSAADSANVTINNLTGQ